jgi:cell division protein FtsW
MHLFKNEVLTENKKVIWRNLMKGRKPFDFWIFMTVLILLSIGIIMLFSASAPFSYSNFGDVYYMLKRQLFFTIIGFVVMIITMNVDYKIYEKYSTLLLAISIVLLALVRVPGIGVYENGAYRWIEVGPLRFQPSEIAKLGMIFFFSQSLSKRKDKLNYFFKDLFPYLLLMGIVAGLLLLEPHLKLYNNYPCNNGYYFILCRSENKTFYNNLNTISRMFCNINIFC